MAVKRPIHRKHSVTPPSKSDSPAPAPEAGVPTLPPPVKKPVALAVSSVLLLLWILFLGWIALVTG